MKWLIFGHNGWIGKQVIKLLENDTNNEIITCEYRVEDEINIENIITTKCPNRIICVIGRTYGDKYNSIDYLEQKGKLVENMNDNLYSPVFLAYVQNIIFI